MFQAIGAERVESLCDLLNGEIAGNSALLKSRFSPGYGDFPIRFQKEIFSVLQCSKNVGVHLNESLFMSPSKSVTAVIGVCDGAENDERNECKRCVKTDCEYRNGL